MTLEEMRRLRNQGLTYQAIADNAGVSRQRVHFLLTYSRAEIAAKAREYQRKKRGAAQHHKTSLSSGEK